MPLLDELYIGTQGGGVNGMVTVSSLGMGSYSPHIQEGAFTVDPVMYSKIIQDVDGSVIEQGWKQCAWHISGLRAAQYDALIAFRVALTTTLYIRTLSEDAATYKNYLVKAIFPPVVIRGEPTAVEDGPVLDFELRFIQMVEQV